MRRLAFPRAMVTLDPMSRKPPASSPDNVTDPAQAGLPLAELGRTGLAHYTGRLADEYLNELQGTKAVRVYREMADNEPVIGALLYLVEMFVRSAQWRAERANVGDRADLADEAERARALLESAMGDMDHSWQEFVSQAILTSVVYGYAPFEPIYKLRAGAHPGALHMDSRFEDGAWGWRRFGPRHPDTLYRWDFADDGVVRGFHQRPPPDYRERYLPMERLFLFRIRSPKDSPEGRSLLRTAYRPWYFKKNMEEIEGIGVERDLAGLPVLEVPPEIMHPNATADQVAIRTAAEQMVRRVRRNEYEGVVLASEEVRGQKTGFRFRLLSSGGTRAMSTDTIVRRYESRILMTFAAEFLLLGTEPNGSRALGESKTSTFSIALQAINQTFADQLNAGPVAQLLEANGIPPLAHARIVSSPIDAPELPELAQFVATMAGAGLLVPGDDDEEWVRGLAKMPSRQIATLAPAVGGPDMAPTAAAGDQPASASALNGAQVTSALEIVARVAQGALPREAGVGMLREFFSLAPDAAERIMGEVGRSFVAAPTQGPAG